MRPRVATISRSKSVFWPCTISIALGHVLCIHQRPDGRMTPTDEDKDDQVKMTTAEPRGELDELFLSLGRRRVTHFTHSIPSSTTFDSTYSDLLDIRQLQRSSALLEA